MWRPQGCKRPHHKTSTKGNVMSITVTKIEIWFFVKRQKSERSQVKSSLQCFTFRPCCRLHDTSSAHSKDSDMEKYANVTWIPVLVDRYRGVAFRAQYSTDVCVRRVGQLYLFGVQARVWCCLNFSNTESFKSVYKPVCHLPLNKFISCKQKVKNNRFLHTASSWCTKRAKPDARDSVGCFNTHNYSESVSVQKLNFKSFLKSDSQVMTGEF